MAQYWHSGMCVVTHINIAKKMPIEKYFLYFR